MMWIVFSVAAPVLWAASNLIDSRLLEDRRQYASALVVLTGLAAGIPGVAVLLLGRLQALDGTVAWLAILSGFASLAAYYPYFRALRLASVSDILLLWNVAPVAVAILARVVLREELTARQLIGVVTLVLGSMVAALQPSVRRSGFAAVPWMALASLLIGIEAISEKAVFLRTSFAAGYPWISLAHFVLALIVAVLQPDIRRALVNRTRPAVMGSVAMNEALDVGAGLAKSAAVSLGPVSIVYAIGALQPVFLMLYAQLTCHRRRHASNSFRPFYALRTALAVGLAVCGVWLLESGA